MNSFATFILIASAAGTGLLACLVMFVFGLLRRRKAIWGSAVLLGLLSGVVLVADIAWAAGRLWHKGSEAAAGTWHVAKDNAHAAATSAADRARGLIVQEVAEAIAPALAGTQPTDEGMRQWYKWSTGLDLPPDARLLAGKCISGMLDTYYIKVEIKGFSDSLRRDYKASPERSTSAPPSDWQADLPFWNADEIAKGEHFSRSMTDADGSPWQAAASYNKATGILYFVGMQCRD